MLVHAAIHVLLVLLLAPLLPGVINKTKAAFAGRRGPPVLQLYWDLARLLRKGMVVSRTTTLLFMLGPAAGLVTALLVAAIVPLGGHRAPIAFAGDVIFVAYLLGLGRFCTALAALDTGSPFEGMGAAREVTFAWLAEPALFLGFLVLARVTGSLSLSGMLAADQPHQQDAALGSMALVLVGWCIVLLAENSRIPFDDPNTHLELTMVHEVMVLDHSGPALAMILYGAAVKLMAIGAMVVGVALPVDPDSPWLGWLTFLGAILGLAILIGVVESIMARLRIVTVPRLLVSASLLTAFAVVLLLA